MTTPVPWDPVIPEDPTFELDARRTQIDGVISQKPTSIFPVRTEYEDDGAGGRRPVTRVSEVPVVVRLDNTSRFPTTDTAGRNITQEWQLLAEWDADLQRGDRFTVGTTEMVVDWLEEPPLPYRTLGGVRSG